MFSAKFMDEAMCPCMRGELQYRVNMRPLAVSLSNAWEAYARELTPGIHRSSQLAVKDQTRHGPWVCLVQG